MKRERREAADERKGPDGSKRKTRQIKESRPFSVPGADCGPNAGPSALGRLQNGLAVLWTGPCQPPGQPDDKELFMQLDREDKQESHRV